MIFSQKISSSFVQKFGNSALNMGSQPNTSSPTQSSGEFIHTPDLFTLSQNSFSPSTAFKRPLAQESILFGGKATKAELLQNSDFIAAMKDPSQKHQNIAVTFNTTINIVKKIAREKPEFHRNTGKTAAARFTDPTKRYEHKITKRTEAYMQQRKKTKAEESNRKPSE